jgi:Spy/CpxP family protein refolding chaperone
MLRPPEPVGSKEHAMKHFRMAATLAGMLAAAVAAMPATAQVPAGDPPPPPGVDGGRHGPGMHEGKGGRHGRGMHGPGMMMPGMEGHMLMRMADELGLSPEQRQTIRGFFESAQPGFRDLHERMRANTKLMMDTQPDDPKYQSVVQQVGQSSAELAQQMVQQSSQLRTQVWSVLTADQKTKLKAKQAEMRAKWEERRAERQAARAERQGARTEPKQAPSAGAPKPTK